ncbi:MAG: J domain-containing protein [Dehalococcoidia bacterium]|nr:J domain-containing protein [Dehalococcoidia bacterium]
MRKFRYYEILEINRDASQEEVNAAFRRLARVWHPDRNPDQDEAEAIFRRINTAYQVLNNETSRAEYDRSPVECPTCGTHEVIGMNDGRWQCKHCGCRFDAAGAPEIQAIDVPSAPPLRRARFRAFQATQCSWCERFYVRSPSTCPHASPQTNCAAFKPVTESERRNYLANAAMPTLVDEWMRPTAERNLIKKCTYCGALSPNPSRTNEPCWNCHRPLKVECPLCGLPMMFYDIEQGAWRCANNQCSGRRFAFDSTAGTWAVSPNRTTTPPPARSSRRRTTQPTCPRCGAGLIYSNQQSMWCCVVCRDFFTPEQAGWPAPQDAPIPVRAPKKKRGERASARTEARRRKHEESYVPPVYAPAPKLRKKRGTGDYVLLAAAIGLIIIIGTMVILGLSGQLG